MPSISDIAGFAPVTKTVGNPPHKILAILEAKARKSIIAAIEQPGTATPDLCFRPQAATAYHRPDVRYDSFGQRAVDGLAAERF